MKLLLFALLFSLSSHSALERKPFPISRQTQTDSEGFYQMPLILGEDFRDGKDPIKKIRRDFQVAKNLGIKYLRFGISWLTIETYPGEYKWKVWDNVLREAQKAGITLMPYVAYTPKWATSRRPYDPALPPDDLYAYGRFFYELVKRQKQEFPGLILSWEVWNEPDVDAWKGSTAQFAEMARFAAKEIRRADPEATLILGGLTMGPSEEYFWHYLVNERLGDYFDIIPYHIYPETWWAERIDEVLPSWPEEMAEGLSRFAPHAEIWLNEYGYADYRFADDKASMWSEEPDIYYGYEHSREYQAVVFQKIQMANLATEKVAATAWYRINDYRKPEDINDGDPVNLHLGLLDVDGKPKPVYFAAQAYQRLFDQPVRNISAKVKIERPFGSQSVIHVFERKDGTLIIAAWLRSSTKEEVLRIAPQDKWGNLVDSRREQISIILPAQFSGGSAITFDALGKKLAGAPVLENGEVKDLELTGDSFRFVVIEKR